MMHGQKDIKIKLFVLKCISDVRTHSILHKIKIILCQNKWLCIMVMRINYSENKILRRLQNMTTFLCSRRINFEQNINVQRSLSVLFTKNEIYTSHVTRVTSWISLIM
jgi:hypothetical protein